MTQEASSPNDPTTPHEAARLLAAAGYHIVPIKQGGKHPPLNDWWNAATTDPATVDAWYTGLYAKDGVGIATGYDRVFVLDVDIADGKAGDETLHDLEQTYAELPESVEQRTGSGGRHIFLKAPPGVEIRNDAGRRLGPGLDIRGIGGQVVVAPTIHPNGQPYVWYLGCAPWERAVADAPGWLIDLLTKDDPWNTTPSPFASRTTAGSEASAPAAGEASLPTWTQQKPSMNGTPTSSIDRPGDRFNASTTWETLLTADGWTRTRDGHEGEQHWTRPGKSTKDGISATVGYKGSDVLKVFTSSVPTLAQDATYTRYGYWTATRHAGDFEAATRALGDLERADVAGIIGRWGSHSVTPNSGDDAAPTPSEGQPGLFQWRIAWPGFWTRDHLDENWHLAPILARGRGHAIWAGAKTGKSYHVLPMALALATGRAHLDKGATEPEHVIYMDYEMTEDDLHDRLTEFGYGPDVDLEHLHYISLPSIPGLDTAEGALYVIEAARTIGATTVIIDTISRAVVGPENDADTIRAFYRHTGQALKHLGVTWARLDHGGKDPTKGQRGNSAKNDDVDLVWKLTRRDGGMSFEATHRRMSWVPERVDVTVTEDDDGITTFRIPQSFTWPVGTQRLADELDRLEVPVNVGRPTARKALHAAQVTATNEVLAAALRYRKSCPSSARTALGHLLSGMSEGQSGQSEETAGHTVRTVLRTASDSDPSVSADRSVSLETDSPHADRPEPLFNPFD